MTKFKGLFERALSSNNGQYVVSFLTADRHAAEELQKIDVAEFQTVEVKKHVEKRSLDANAYFHVLIGKIAEEMRLGIEEVKKQIVCEYGTVAFIARIPKDANLDNIYYYAKCIGDSKDTKKPCADWYIFKPTHTLDKAEMARLIDGTVETAKELNIETRTPDELENLKSMWRQAQ